MIGAARRRRRIGHLASATAARVRRPVEGPRPNAALLRLRSDHRQLAGKAIATTSIRLRFDHAAITRDLRYERAAALRPK